jgi:hypothetical protein
MPEISTRAAATPTAAPPVTRRFESSPAARFSRSAPRGRALRTRSRARRSRRARQTPAQVHAASPALLVLFAATPGVSLARRRCGACPRGHGFENAAPRRLPVRCPRRAATTRARSRGPAHAAGRSRRARQTTVHVQGASPPPLALFFAARGRASPALTRRRAVAARAGAASKGARARNQRSNGLSHVQASLPMTRQRRP